MVYKVQRFANGHPLYSDSIIKKDGKEYKAVFGQFTNEQGEVLHYTMERADTLIKEGEYTFGFFDSPANKCKVILLMEDPDGKNISSRKLEHHIANFPYELKGCCAHGMTIDVKKPMINKSGVAFKQMMDLIKKPGIIIYETFKNISA